MRLLLRGAMLLFVRKELLSVRNNNPLLILLRNKILRGLLFPAGAKLASLTSEASKAYERSKKGCAVSKLSEGMFAKGTFLLA